MSLNSPERCIRSSLKEVPPVAVAAVSTAFLGALALCCNIQTLAGACSNPSVRQTLEQIAKVEGGLKFEEFRDAASRIPDDPGSLRCASAAIEMAAGRRTPGKFSVKLLRGITDVAKKF